MRPFRKPAFRLALSEDATVLPVTTRGTWRIWPRGRLFPRLRGPMEYIFHPPVALATFRDESDPAAALLAHVRRVIQGPLGDGPDSLSAPSNPR
jgi:1-acyl-sn-glycerol-3-phosphate acyltransferase